ncbi:Helicase C-terminal domain family protein [Babesia bovis T2Bo]|uniref:Helicase ATP-binding domain-containing protein n=1 Tax=Babesia bovis TaxID=5865 RepID=A7ANP8_BABBO|nr:Helicase C-terminal domain family protein [Babesia bovis T2Bo]EDO08182.1 Helicase C-terminal domain family protein [Babesia bovis T2Bo]|eukprot:XP_001611750.1 hypothetical protein [Babesia bovis T2Bo]
MAEEGAVETPERSAQFNDEYVPFGFADSDFGGLTILKGLADLPLTGNVNSGSVCSVYNESADTFDDTYNDPLDSDSRNNSGRKGDKKRKADLERSRISNDAVRILDMYHRYGVIDTNDPILLELEPVRAFFTHIDRLYRTPKISLADAFTRALQQLTKLPRLIKRCSTHLKKSKEDDTTETTDTEHRNVVVWENVKMQRNIGGVQVLFHFPTMQKPQIQLLAKLMHALKNSQHVVLESPTGTGKTAAILAGVFSWMFQNHIRDASMVNTDTKPGEGSAEKPKKQEPRLRVIYLTRTHAQIKQVIQAVKTCGFRPRSCSIASRLQMCIYKSNRAEAEGANSSDSGEDVPNLQNRINLQCRKLVANADKGRLKANNGCTGCFSSNANSYKKEKMCPYYLNMGSKHFAVDTAMKVLGRTESTFDIEDLMRYGIEGTSEDVDLPCSCGKSFGGKSKKLARRLASPAQDITQYFSPKAMMGLDDPVELGVCPYYAAKSIAQVSEFVVCPYPYVLDLQAMVKGVSISQKVAGIIQTDPRFKSVKNETMEIMNDKTNVNGVPNLNIFGNLNDTVLVFDEGHNVENACQEEASWDIKFDLIKRILSWIKKMREEVIASSGLSYVGVDDLKTAEKLGQQALGILLRVTRFLNDLLLFLQGFVSNLKIPPKKGVDNRGESILYSWDTYDDKSNPLGGAQRFIDALNLDIASMYVLYCSVMQMRAFVRHLRPTTVRQVEEYLIHLEFMTATMVMLCHKPECYNVLILVNANKSYSLGLWLMNPSAMFSELAANAKSIVIASGTLSPIPAMVSSLGPEFESRVNGNIISTTQQLDPGNLAVYMVTHFSRSTKERIQCDFANQKDERFQTQLGHSLAKLLEVLPGGTLIFFTSKAILTSCIEHWRVTAYNDASVHGESRTIYDHIASLKGGNLYQEPNEASEFQKLLKELHVLDMFVMFAVCRSHSSEGLNLKLSSLILVGLPYPSTIAPRVDIARRYNRASGQKYNWYLRETFRAVNQAIGRCIRNKKDRGVIILMDNRYKRDREYLPSWTNPFIRSHNIVDDVRHDIQTGFTF